jgi:hypothetical protein
MLSSALDRMSPEDQEKITASVTAEIIMATMEERAGKPAPPEAAGKFAGVLERIAQVDANFMVATKDVTPAHEAARAAFEEWAKADEPEKELDDESGDEYETESVIGMPEDKCRVCGEHIGYGDPRFHLGICEECDTDEESEVNAHKLRVVELGNGGRVAFRSTEEQAATIAEQFKGRVVEPDDDNEDDEEFELPELTPEIMMKMLANMQANGLM